LTYKEISRAPIFRILRLMNYQAHRPAHTQMAILRQIIALLPLFLLGGLACAAAQMLASPAIAQLIFYVCLGLFFVALADGILQGEVETPAGNPQASQLELRDDQFGTGG
jgi:hypothetical protein